MIKERYTSKFNKDNFVIDAMSIDVDSDLDPLIEDFIYKLNESNDIMTIYSCEGHKENDTTYLMFNVSDKGWDIFWGKIMPELSERFCIVIPKLFGNSLYQTEWFVSTVDNKYNTAISVHCKLTPFRDIFTWEDKKQEFWKIITEVFLTHFK